MAIDFKPGFPQQRQGTSIVSDITDSYMKMAQMSEAMKVKREQDNMTSFEESVSNLFYNNSLVKGKLSNVNGN